MEISVFNYQYLSGNGKKRFVYCRHFIVVNAISKTFKANPLHDWSSHLADSFRYLSLAWKTIRPEPIAIPEPVGWTPEQFRPRAPKGRIKLT